MGDVMGDIIKRRGEIIRNESQTGGIWEIDAYVPLSEMFGYATALRSRTQGRGQYTMEPSHFAEVPKSILDNIVSKRQTSN